MLTANSFLKVLLIRERQKREHPNCVKIPSDVRNRGYTNSLPSLVSQEHRRYVPCTRSAMPLGYARKGGYTRTAFGYRLCPMSPNH